MQENDRILELANVDTDKSKISALSPLALDHGLHDKYDKESKKRFVTSPSQLKINFDAIKGIVMPIPRGKSTGGDFVYEIPVDAVAMEVISLEDTPQHQLKWDPRKIISDFGKTNSRIDKVFLREPYWAVGNGILIPIFFENDGE